MPPPSAPLRKQGWALLVEGIFVLALSAHALVRGVFHPALPIGSAAAALVLLAMGTYLLVFARGMALIGPAVDAFTRGRHDEAEALLAAIPPIARRWSLARRVHFLRAWIAFRAGIWRDAVDQASKALNTPSPRLERIGDRQLQVSVLALRALAAASDGNEATARADIEAVRNEPRATGMALAEAALAEALILTRRGDHDRLAVLVRRDRRLLFELTGPTERRLARELRRKLEVAREGAYRRPARQEGAEAGARDDSSAAAKPRAGEVVVAAEAVTRLAASIHSRTKARAQMPALKRALLVIGLGWAGFWGLQEMQKVRGGPSVFDALWLIVAVFVSVHLYSVAKYTLRAGRGQRRLAEASRAEALEGWQASRYLLTVLASETGLVGAQAEVQLAAFAERAALFEEALAACDRGLAKLGAADGIHVRPQLLGHKAYALAALSKPDAARTHLALLEQTFPGFFALGVTKTRVGLMLAVREGDLDRARTIAQDRTADLAGGLRDEILADAVVAIRNSSPDEAARIERELADDPELDAWLRIVAPSLVEDVHRIAR